MQEPTTAPTTANGLEDSASALLEAIVRAEVELSSLQERCDSLELAISLGQEAVTTAGSLPPDASAKGNSGDVASLESAPHKEMPAASVLSGPAETAKADRAPAPIPAPAASSAPPPPSAPEPIRPPKPLTIRPQGAEKPVPVLEPAVASAAPSETGEAETAASTKPESDAVSRALEEQAAALRAAMEESPAPSTKERPAVRNEPPVRPERPVPARPPAPDASDPKPDPAEPRAFKPKRSTPLKTRLAGRDVSPAEGEAQTYSERSAELEQLLRSRDDG
jgi:hypothetical protein